MHFHVKADRAARMCLVAGDAFALVVQGFVHVFLDCAVEVAAGVDRQAVAAGTDILIKRQAGFLGADIPQGHIHRAGQEHREKRFVAVDGPQLLEDGLAVMGITAQHHGTDALLQVGFAHSAAAGSHTGGNAFNAGIGGQLDGNHIPAHLSAALTLFVKQAAAALDPPCLEFGNNHQKHLFLFGTV